MLPLGSPLPTFSLPDAVSGDTISSESLAGKPVLLTVICNHCPFVVHIKEELVRVGNELAQKGVAMVAISSNDVSTHPTDGPEQMKADAEKYGYPFPYVFDESQVLAQTLRAMCTPEFYLFDSEGKLVYRGRLDASSPGNGLPVTGDELRAAVDALLSGKAPIEPQHPSRGCSVKWKEGNVPGYFNA
jgi:peroxiredoxin